MPAFNTKKAEKTYDCRVDTTGDNKLVSSGPCVDARECVGAVVSNGRIFYTSQANGLQISQVYGAEAESITKE